MFYKIFYKIKMKEKENKKKNQKIIKNNKQRKNLLRYGEDYFDHPLKFPLILFFLKNKSNKFQYKDIKHLIKEQTWYAFKRELIKDKIVIVIRTRIFKIDYKILNKKIRNKFNEIMKDIMMYAKGFSKYKSKLFEINNDPLNKLKFVEKNRFLFQISDLLEQEESIEISNPIREFDKKYFFKHKKLCERINRSSIKKLNFVAYYKYFKKQLENENKMYSGINNFTEYLIFSIIEKFYSINNIDTYKKIENVFIFIFLTLKIENFRSWRYKYL